MIRAACKSLIQLLTDPRLWLVIALSILLSLACFGALWYGLRWALQSITAQWAHLSWLHFLQQYGTSALAFIAALLLFPSTLVLIASFFQEWVADLVERRHYPHLGPANGLPLGASVRIALRQVFRSVSLNTLALPVYLGLTFFLGSGALLMIAVNGLILGREYCEIVACRRLSPPEVTAFYRQHRLPLFLTGTTIAALGMIPVLNLLAPITGIVLMVHTIQTLTPGTPAVPPR